MYTIYVYFGALKHVYKSDILPCIGDTYNDIPNFECSSQVVTDRVLHTDGVTSKNIITILVKDKYPNLNTKP